MIRYLIIFKGRVQGVGFRYIAQRKAISLNLTGYVKNLESGDVEVQIEGDQEAINAFIAYMLNQNNFIKVYDYSLKKIELKKDKSFLIIY